MIDVRVFFRASFGHAFVPSFFALTVCDGSLAMAQVVVIAKTVPIGVSFLAALKTRWESFSGLASFLSLALGLALGFALSFLGLAFAFAFGFSGTLAFLGFGFASLSPSGAAFQSLFQISDLVCLVLDVLGGL